METNFRYWHLQFSSPSFLCNVSKRGSTGCQRSIYHLPSNLKMGPAKSCFQQLNQHLLLLFHSADLSSYAYDSIAYWPSVLKYTGVSWTLYLLCYEHETSSSEPFLFQVNQRLNVTNKSQYCMCKCKSSTNKPDGHTHNRLQLSLASFAHEEVLWFWFPYLRWCTPSTKNCFSRASKSGIQMFYLNFRESFFSIKTWHP